MTERTVTHGTFVLERIYPATPARAFKAWSDPKRKARWFMGGASGEDNAYELDFRIGGRELNKVKTGMGVTFVYDAIYQDIVPDNRIVYSYDMLMDENRISVSLATVEFRPEGKGTRLVFTEQGAFLDGHDDPKQRQEGTEQLLDMLGKDLERGD